MPLYTGKGDDGTTKLFNCPPNSPRLSKSALIFEALGTVDELNSSLGFAKTLAKQNGLQAYLNNQLLPYSTILETLQQNLFCLQAELSGSATKLKTEHLKFLEQLINEIEKRLPSINSFIVSGGHPVSAYLDVTRAQARRAERLVVAIKEKQKIIISDLSLQFLNRLSSVLYALARFANHQTNITETQPTYQ